MAKGHTAVVRRSLNLPEWIRVRLAEISHWQLDASAPVDRWEIRDAAYHAPGQYQFTSDWRPIREGDIWGHPDGTFFLRTTIHVGAEFRGLPVTFELLTPTEMLVSIDGELLNAFDPNRSEIPLLKKARGDETLAVEIEAYMRSAPDDQRIGSRLPEGHGCVQTWRNPALVSYNPIYRRFMYDLQLVLDVASCPTVDSDICNLMYAHADAAIKLIDRDTTDRGTFQRSLESAGEHLRKTVYSMKQMAAPGRLALVGHSHIDIAYHWRVRQGVRKNARTTLVQLALMDEYPEFLYCHTQPYLYEQLKLHYPQLWKRLKVKVKSGQWELIGGMYVEPDCNVPSGESFIRQCLLGKLFCLKEFGIDVDTCWLPDVFGNSWILPQILAKSGIRYFVSNKMSTWNDTNKFPHNNFVWKGADGSTVNACVPASHFISWLAPDQLLANWDGFQEKINVGESMNMYGFGDGGGGVTREILETARRLEGFPGLPQTRLVTAKTYLEEAFDRGQKLDVWDDELYLEMHRGVSTTKAILKKLNRRCELVAREAELFSVLAEPFGLKVPAAALTEAWKTVLVNQFHDILPGSHTNPVGVEAVETYTKALETFTSIRDSALDSIGANVAPAADDAADGERLVVFNSLNGPHTGLVEVPLPDARPRAVFDSTGAPAGCQMCDDGSRSALLFMARDVPSVGYAAYRITDADSRGAEGESKSTDEPAPRATRDLLENRLFRIELNESGEIMSLLDKRLNRQVVADGQVANQLQLFEDKPGMYDAWDIVPMYKDKPLPIGPVKNFAVIENGPVRAGVRFDRSFFGSTLTQTIWIYRDIARIDFVTHVDWHEHNKLLKVAFPVAVLARRATYDLSYGSITRPTHANTSWDRAKFEVTGHQWADLSEAGYGVSLLNDCKYGHDITGNVMRLTLLRGPIRPDPDSDQGPHDFTYSLYPHADSWQNAGTVQAAHMLNSPLIARRLDRQGGKLPAVHSFLRVEPSDVFIGALKKPEQGKGRILRLVEVLGGRKDVTVHLPKSWKISAASETDLLERPIGPIAATDRLHTTLSPFEIKTFRLES